MKQNIFISNKSRIVVAENGNNFTVDFSTQLPDFPNVYVTNKNVNFSSFGSNKNLGEFFDHIYNLVFLVNCQGDDFFQALLLNVRVNFIPVFSKLTGETFKEIVWKEED